MRTAGPLNVSGSAILGGNLTVGDGGAEDQKIVLDGNATDYYLGLDDTDDTFKVGLGSAVGTNAALTVNTTGLATFPLSAGIKVTGDVSGSARGIFVTGLTTAGPLNVTGSSILGGGVIGNVSGSGRGIFVEELRTAGPLNVSGSAILGGNLTVGDGGAEDQKIVLDGNATDFYLGLDDTDDTFKLGLGSAVGTNAALTVSTTGLATFPLSAGVKATGDVSGSARGIFVTGLTTAGPLNVTGSSTLAGGITGDVSGSARGIFVTGLTTAGDLNVTGSAILGGNLTVGDGGAEDQKICLLYTSDAADEP